MLLNRSGSHCNTIKTIEKSLFLSFFLFPNGSNSDKDGSLLAAVVALFRLLFDVVVAGLNAAGPPQNRESVHATTTDNNKVKRGKKKEKLKVGKIRWEAYGKKVYNVVFHRVQSRPIVTDSRPPWFRQQPMHIMLYVYNILFFLSISLFLFRRWLTAHPWKRRRRNRKRNLLNCTRKSIG